MLWFNEEHYNVQGMQVHWHIHHLIDIPELISIANEVY